MHDFDTYNTDTQLGCVDIYSDKLNFTSAHLQANLAKRVRRLIWDEQPSVREAPFIFFIPEKKWTYTGLPLNNIILSAPRAGFLVKYTNKGIIEPYFPTKEDKETSDWYVVDPDEDLY